MNGFTRTPRRVGPPGLLWLGSVVLGVTLGGPNRAEAAAIHHAHDSSASGVGRTWSEYLMGGPSVWSAVAHPALTPGIEAAMWKSINSDPPSNPSAVVQFFEYRQSVDAARFDHYHPRIAAALAKLAAESATPTTPTTSTTASPTVQPQTLTPPTTTTSPPDVTTVPEPATFLLTIGMAGYAVWWRRRRT